ncbi:MAG: hypothetical protein P8P74_18015 [Crocinitomicaceae bacterium]|nr:hypothetical protein [Crocinitomicaceae bacterium]
MAISKKGLRKIVVHGRIFYWKFKEKVFVMSEENRNQLLIIDFGWFDVWLYVNSKEQSPAEFEPKAVTPKFVRESIVFASLNGWDSGKMELKFRNGKYEICGKH